MVDVPTPDEIGEEARQGNEPTSLGDVARGDRDPVLSEGNDVPDAEETQTREG